MVLSLVKPLRGRAVVHRFENPDGEMCTKWEIPEDVAREAGIGRGTKVDLLWAPLEKKGTIQADHEGIVMERGAGGKLQAAVALNGKACRFLAGFEGVRQAEIVVVDKGKVAFKLIPVSKC